MLNKITQMFLIFVTLGLLVTFNLVCSLEKRTKENNQDISTLNMYMSYEKDDSLTIPEMIPIYVGPLYITGGAYNEDTGKAPGYYTINDCKPTKLGEIRENSILINGDTPNDFDTFAFKTIEYFKVVTKNMTDTFYVMHMNSKMRDKNFEIVVELNDGPNYDRVIYLFQNGKKYMMLLWKDNMNIIEPDKSNEI